CNRALSRMAIKCHGCRFRALGVKRPASRILCMVFSGRSFGKKVRVVRRVRIHSKVSMHASLRVSAKVCMAAQVQRSHPCQGILLNHERSSPLFSQGDRVSSRAVCMKFLRTTRENNGGMSKGQGDPIPNDATSHWCLCDPHMQGVVTGEKARRFCYDLYR